MTTLITIDTHAGYPVEVTTTERSFPLEGLQGPTVTRIVIPPNQSLGVYIHSQRTIEVRELPLTPAITEPT